MESDILPDVTEFSNLEGGVNYACGTIATLTTVALLLLVWYTVSAIYTYAKAAIVALLPANFAELSLAGKFAYMTGMEESAAQAYISGPGIAFANGKDFILNKMTSVLEFLKSQLESWNITAGFDRITQALSVVTSWVSTMFSSAYEQLFQVIQALSLFVQWGKDKVLAAASANVVQLVQSAAATIAEGVTAVATVPYGAAAAAVGGVVGVVASAAQAARTAPAAAGVVASAAEAATGAVTAAAGATGLSPAAVVKTPDQKLAEARTIANQKPQELSTLRKIFNSVGYIVKYILSAVVQVARRLIGAVFSVATYVGLVAGLDWVVNFVVSFFRFNYVLCTEGLTKAVKELTIVGPNIFQQMIKGFEKFSESAVVLDNTLPSNPINNRTERKTPLTASPHHAAIRKIRQTRLTRLPVRVSPGSASKKVLRIRPAAGSRGSATDRILKNLRKPGSRGSSGSPGKKRQVSVTQRILRNRRGSKERKTPLTATQRILRSRKL